MFGKESPVLLLQELIKDWPCTVTGGRFRIEVKGITECSKNVKPGFIFVARKGKKDDGVKYIDDALRQGAVAVVVERTVLPEIPTRIPIITVPDCRKFISHASATFSGKPSERLTVIAITGTNGKTTVSFFIGQMLAALGEKVAVIGTTGVYIQSKKIDFEAPDLTTLPAEYLHPLLRLCEQQGVTHVVMEASSLGLEAHRLTHCEIDVGILLNIGKDHYDEHGGKDSYVKAKKILLQHARQMIVNCDDEASMRLVKEVDCLYTYFGTGKGAHIRLKKKDDELFVSWEENEEPLLLSLVGHYNHLNALAAISALRVLSYDMAILLKTIPELELPRGRMERLEEEGVSVIIDYAHTPDALEAILHSLNDICLGKLITVFGCGGDRDKGKRKEMGKIASVYSSTIIITSDNPRKEDPLAIIASIVEGVDENLVRVEIEPNRAEAIRKAIAGGEKKDIILIAGKGHERTQQIGENIFSFSDKEEAKKALADKKKNK